MYYRCYFLIISDVVSDVSRFWYMRCYNYNTALRSKKYNFPTASWKFLAENIVGAQNLNFAPKFPHNGWLSAQYEKKFWTKKNFQQKAVKERQLPPSPQDTINAHKASKSLLSEKQRIRQMLRTGKTTANWRFRCNLMTASNVSGNSSDVSRTTFCHYRLQYTHTHAAHSKKICITTITQTVLADKQ